MPLPNSNAVSFNVSARVGFEESFRGWQPAQIAAFMRGIAQVISAAQLGDVTITSTSPVTARCSGSAPSGASNHRW